MIDENGKIIEEKPSSGAEKIKQGLKQLHPEDTKRKEYIPPVAGKAKQLIQEGLEELQASVDKDGNPMELAKTREQKALAKILGEPEDG